MIRVVKDSAGHILAEQFGFDGIERYAPPVVAMRAARKRRKRSEPRLLPLTFLRLLAHHPMEAKPRHPGKRRQKQARRIAAAKAAFQSAVSA